MNRILQTTEAEWHKRKGLWFKSWHYLILPMSSCINLFYLCKTHSPHLLLRELNDSIHTKGLPNPVFLCLLLHKRLPLLNHIDFFFIFKNFFKILFIYLCIYFLPHRFKGLLLPAMVGTLEAVANSKTGSLPLRSVQSNREEKTHIRQIN